MRKLVFITAAFLCASFSDSCMRREVAIVKGTPGKPVQLLSGLRSYMSPLEAREVVSSRNWWVVEDTRRPTSPPTGCRSPEFTVQRMTVRVEHHVLEGTKGELTLEFIDGMLLRTSFSPADGQAFLLKIARRLGFDLELDEGIFYGSVTRIIEGRIIIINECCYWLEDEFLESFSGY